MKIFTDFETNACECCGRTHMRQTFKISNPNFGDINLGVICCSRWFGVNLTGNIHTARTRLENKIKNMKEEEVFYTVEKIKLSKYGDKHE